MLDAECSSVHGGALLLLGPGDPLGEMAFFTETPCFEVMRGQGQRRGGMWHGACVFSCCG